MCQGNQIVLNFLSQAGVHSSLDRIVVLGEQDLRSILRRYFEYYRRTRTHSSLAKDAPEHTKIESPARCKIIEINKVGGLH